MASNKQKVRFVPSLDRVRGALKRRLQEVRNLTAPNREVAALLDRFVQRNFRTEGGNVGGWTPFKRGGRYIPGRGLDTSAKLLQHTGQLRASFRSRYDRRRASIRSDIGYAAPHQFGTSTLPQRRMLPNEDEVIGDIVKIHAKHVGLKFRRSMW